MDFDKKIIELCEHYRDSVEKLSSAELLDMDIIDAYYTVDAGLCYVSARLYLSMGGPTVYIDTGDGYVHLSYGHEDVKCRLSFNRIKEIDNIHAERFFGYSDPEV